jgi:ferredoxin-NADP reductase/nitrite reductase/ring-hydroxylating ferredoxin subunit
VEQRLSKMWHQFAPSLDRGQRLHGNVGGRFVTALRLTNGKLRCIDSTCYHAGGPLGIGEIEELNGEACIKCPWHSYPVALSDGGKLYQALELDKATKKLLPAGWKKKERAQRVHDIEERAGGTIWIRLNQSPEKYDSDEYAGSAICAERVQAGDLAGQRKGRDGSMPPGIMSSGQVFQEQRWRPCKVLSVVPDGSEGIRLKLACGPTFKPKPYPTLMMDAMELFAHTYVVARIGSVQRYYTPLATGNTEEEDQGIVTLAVRVYPGAMFGSSLARLKQGDILDMRPAGATDPPASALQTLAPAQFLPQKFKRVLLLAAGSGITPMIAVCRSIMDNTPEAKVTLLCFNRSPETELCRDVIQSLMDKYAHRIVWVRAFSRKLTGPPPSTRKESSVYAEQRVSAEFVAKFVFPKLGPGEERVLVSASGPPGFLETTSGEIKKAGFRDEIAFFVPFVG